MTWAVVVLAVALLVVVALAVSQSRRAARVTTALDDARGEIRAVESRAAGLAENVEQIQTELEGLRRRAEQAEGRVDDLAAQAQAAREALADAETARELAEDRLVQVAAELEEAAHTIRSLEADLRAAEAAGMARVERPDTPVLSEAPAPVPPPADVADRAAALWALELVRAERASEPLELDATPLVDGDAGAGLLGALGNELEALREQVGTWGQITRAEMPETLGVLTALGALRVAQEVLGVAAKRAEQVEIELSEVAVPVGPDAALRPGRGALGLLLRFEGWEPPAELRDRLPVVAEAVAGLGGSLHVDDADGRLVVALALPLDPSGAPASGTGSGARVAVSGAAA